MTTYAYKFVTVPRQRGGRPGDSFAACKQVIADAAQEGWRLVQVVTPFNEKMGISFPMGYEVIFERVADEAP